MQTLTIEEIQKIIPHRFPMLLIDRVLDYEAGKMAKAIHNITYSDQFVQASGNASFISPLIVEAMAQTGAVSLLTADEFKGKTAYFGGINKVEFFDQARCGDQVVLTCELTKLRRNIGVGIGKAEVNGKLIAQAELTFMIA